jgi:hypothetical protein
LIEVQRETTQVLLTEIDADWGKMDFKTLLVRSYGYIECIGNIDVARREFFMRAIPGTGFDPECDIKDHAKGVR